MSLYRIRNILIAAVLIIAAFILQCTVINRLPVLGCSPNIILVLTFIYGYSDNKIAGMFVGMFGGLIIDIFFCDVIGYNALVLLVIGFVSGIWNNYFYSDDLYVPLFLLLGSNLFYCLVYYIFWFLLRSRFDLGYYLLSVVIPEFLLTFIAGIILYKPLTLMIRKLNAVSEQ